MKKSIIVALILGLVLAAASPQVFADTLNLTTLPVQQAGGYYVGAIGGNLNGGTSSNYYCNDFATTTVVPSSFSVLVSSLSNLTGTKFSDPNNPALSLQKYQQVGWLMYEMQINPASIPSIQFAMWSVFTPSTPTYGDSAYWLDASTRINAADYDFSKMRIYTPTGSVNQEFIGGSVSAVPEPSQWALLIVGLGLITHFYMRRRGEERA